MVPRFCVFPVSKRQVLLHLFSVLPEVAKHVVTNATLPAETTSHPLLLAKRLANNHAVSGEIHEKLSLQSFHEKYRVVKDGAPGAAGLICRSQVIVSPIQKVS